MFWRIYCPVYYKKNLYPTEWRDKWEEVLDKRTFIRNEGIGEFLLVYYPDVIRRVFGYSVRSATTVERRVRSILDNLAQQYGLIPNLPIVVLNKLGLASSQTQITNFLGNPNPNPYP